MTDVRREFEDWAVKMGYDITAIQSGFSKSYIKSDTAHAWHGWTALHNRMDLTIAKAERWNYALNNHSWLRQDDEDGRFATLAVKLPYEVDLSSKGMVEWEIDKVIKASK